MEIIPKAQLWVIRELFKYKKMSFITTLGALVDIILFSTPPIFLAGIIEELFGSQRLEIVALWIFVFIIVAVVQVTFFFLAAYYNEVLAHRITTDISADLYMTLQNRSLSYLDRFDIGEIMARASNDTRRLNIGLSPAYRLVIQIFLQIVVITLMLNYFEPRFVPLYFFMLPFFFLLVYLYLRKVYPIEVRLLTDFEKISVVSNEAVSGIKELKSYVAEKRFLDRFNSYSKIHSQTNYQQGKNEALYYPYLLFWFFVGLFAIIGIFWILDESLTIAAFAGAISSFLMFKFLSEALSWAAVASATAIASSNRLYKVIFEDESVLTQSPRSGNNKFDPDNTKIEFRNVSFRYTEDTPWALKNASFTINPGETAVIVGPPGSGKSTINKLIQRLYSPNEGVILIGERNILDYDNDSFRKSVVSIEQEIFLFSTSVEENLRFGKLDATMDEIKQATRLAKADKFIEKLPEGYSSEIGERGVKLSGGEKQRIAIARAILLNPSILLMDDASSALDAKTEFEIQNAISTILKTRTSLITTHRLSIIAKASKVIVIDHGEIVAIGKHSKLIETIPDYRKLFEKIYDLPPIPVSLESSGD
ncbi:MAG: ABC transporter ATP-binding protein [Candidatus Hodarchaeales archaeon]|jgi:ATP-binding cassette subfamily B protein